MPRVGNEKHPLVLFDDDQANTAGSYSAVDAANKVNFSTIGMATGNSAINAGLITSKLGNIRYNGHVHVFMHGDGLGTLVLKKKALTQAKLFEILGRIAPATAAYPTISIDQVLIFACGAGQKGGDMQASIRTAKAAFATHCFAASVAVASPMLWYQFGTGSIKIYDSAPGGSARPIAGTTILLNKEIPYASLGATHYHKASIA